MTKQGRQVLAKRSVKLPVRGRQTFDVTGNTRRIAIRVERDAHGPQGRKAFVHRCTGRPCRHAIGHAVEGVHPEFERSVSDGVHGELQVVKSSRWRLHIIEYEAQAMARFLGLALRPTNVCRRYPILRQGFIRRSLRLPARHPARKHHLRKNYDRLRYRPHRSSRPPPPHRPLPACRAAHRC